MTTSYAQSLTVEEIEINAYAVYKRLRAEEPVAYVPALNSWLVTEWDVVTRVTTETDTFTAADKDAPVVRHFGDPAIINVDGAVHRELRKGIAPHYAAQKVAKYIDAIVRPIARECIAVFPENGQVDLLADYFEPNLTLTLARTFVTRDFVARPDPSSDASYYSAFERKTLADFFLPGDRKVNVTMPPNAVNGLLDTLMVHSYA